MAPHSAIGALMVQYGYHNNDPVAPIWRPYGAPMVLLWRPYGASMVPLWQLYGAPMVHLWQTAHAKHAPCDVARVIID